MRAYSLVAVVLLGCLHPAPLLEGELVDLSHAYDADTVYWPTDTEGFVLEKLAAGQTEDGYYYSANRFRTAEHGGTHADAPVHFAERGQTVDAIPLDRLIGPGVVIDVRRAVAADVDYRVGIADLRGWEAAHGRLPDGAIVLLLTGHGAYWDDPERYLGTSRVGSEAVSDLHFPGLHPDAALWLVRERSIGAIGLDTPSIDHGPSRLFRSHRILFAENVPAFENLANLDALPPEGFSVVALPMKIRGGSGAPLRAVAIVPASAR